MDSNEETVHKHIVVDGPGQRREVLTERTVRGPEESRLSTGAIVIIVFLAVVAVGSILYLVTNRNANEAANRNANKDADRDAASQLNRAQAPVVIQQPAAPQQAPIIIQQPAAAPAPQPEQPAQTNPRDSASDDANMQEVATKRLSEELAMSSVSVNISEARAVLSGTVSSADTKAKAEQVVKAVRGVKSVDNKIVVL